MTKISFFKLSKFQRLTDAFNRRFPQLRSLNAYSPKEDHLKMRSDAIAFFKECGVIVDADLEFATWDTKQEYTMFALRWM